VRRLGTGPVLASIGIGTALVYCVGWRWSCLIAFNRFATPIPGVRWPIMIPYWLGQAGIVASAVGGCGMLREKG